MKIDFRLHTQILFCILVLITITVTPQAYASGKDAPSNVSATASLPAPETMHELTPNTVLLKFQTEESQPPLEVTLKQLMDVYKVPGLSVAVIDNNKIAWARGFGVTELGGNKPVTTRTLFQAGSISKPVAAVGSMWLVEHGKLFLDEDVNKKLKSWKVPENDFTKEQKVTLRRLVSHSAGLTVHGFPGYAVDDPVPTLVQIFNGTEPANTDPIRVDFVPGTRMRYSGGGVTIEQQLVIDVTGQPFPQFMHDTVLSKIGMTDSTYQQPLPKSLQPLTATGTRANGDSVEGRWHVYPEMAAAGLWTTPTDLAKFAIEIALSKQGKANHVLSQKSVQEMLTPQIKSEEADGTSVGLAFFLGMENRPDGFGHNGSDEGFQALLVMFADSGKGVAIMGNSDAFFHVAPYIEDAVRQSYDWKSTGAAHPAIDAISLLYALKGPQAAIDSYPRLQQGAVAGNAKPNEATLNSLGYMLMGDKKLDDAIKVFERNVQEYPQRWNCYDSLAEAYMNAGQKDLAIKNYEKSLELNPKNTNGAAMVKKLKGD